MEKVPGGTLRPAPPCHTLHCPSQLIFKAVQVVEVVAVVRRLGANNDVVVFQHLQEGQQVVPIVICRTKQMVHLVLSYVPEEEVKGYSLTSCGAAAAACLCGVTLLVIHQPDVLLHHTVFTLQRIQSINVTLYCKTFNLFHYITKFNMNKILI